MKTPLYVLPLCIFAATGSAQNLIGGYISTEDGCFSRFYTTELYPENVDQPISFMSFGTAGALQIPPAGYDFIANMGFRLRESDTRFSAQAYCADSTEAKLTCALEGDAGTFTVTPAPQGDIFVTFGDVGLTLENEAQVVTLPGASATVPNLMLIRSGMMMCD